jgi:ribosomal protein S12 methylthiotransferase accessory factor YcaO
MSEETQKKIGIVTDSLKEFLIKKNENYGDSALHPIHVFSKLATGEQLKVRMDDKVSRIVNSPELRKNDTVDLMGYLTLICIEKGWMDFKDQID